MFSFSVCVLFTSVSSVVLFLFMAVFSRVFPSSLSFLFLLSVFLYFSGCVVDFCNDKVEEKIQEGTTIKAREDIEVNKTQKDTERKKR